MFSSKTVFLLRLDIQIWCLLSITFFRKPLVGDSMWSKARFWNLSCHPLCSGGQLRGRPATLGEEVGVSVFLELGRDRKRREGGVRVGNGAGC